MDNSLSHAAAYLKIRGIKFSMYLYEYLFIFLTGTALGLIVRYILGYKKHAYLFVAANIILGGIGCVISALFGGLTYLQIFISGAGGVIGECLYSVYSVISTLVFSA